MTERSYRLKGWSYLSKLGSLFLRRKDVTCIRNQAGIDLTCCLEIDWKEKYTIWICFNDKPYLSVWIATIERDRKIIFTDDGDNLIFIENKKITEVYKKLIEAINQILQK